MICPGCRHENPDRAKFCLECGGRLPTACPQFGTELPAAAKFCLECGHRLAAPASPAPAAAAPPHAAAPAADYQSRLASYTPRHLAEKILESRSALEGERRQEAGFGAHRWRWAIHVAAHLAEVLIALGRPGDALVQIERSLQGARSTGSQKYVARAHALRGEIALAAGQWAAAEADLAEGLAIAQRIATRP